MSLDPAPLDPAGEREFYRPGDEYDGNHPDAVPELVEDPHAITRTRYEWGVGWVCACGRWEAVATGASSAAFAGRDHARHKREEEAAADGE